MTKEQIQAIGNFLQNYYTDLYYIKKFQDFKENKISLTDYVNKDIGTFYSFLSEYGVTRNYLQYKTGELLEETQNWVNGSNPDNVDLFAEILSKTDLTRGHTTTVLASKILFLNNPWKILPMDKQTRKALRQRENKYSIYATNLDKYRQINKNIIKECLLYAKPFTIIIHNDFKSKLKNLNIICENRIVDKLLWTTGK